MTVWHHQLNYELKEEEASPGLIVSCKRQCAGRHLSKVSFVPFIIVQSNPNKAQALKDLGYV